MKNPDALLLLLLVRMIGAGAREAQDRPAFLAGRPSGRPSQFGTLCLATPVWSELERMFGDAYSEERPSVIDSVLQPEKPVFSTERPTLFRERHGWCPYSERVWLTLELLGVPYDTVRIDNTGRGKPSYYAGFTPQLKWPDGQIQGESLDLMRDLEDMYARDIVLHFNNPDVQHCISQFRSIFPSGARPSSRAAYLFQGNGDPLWRSVFEETLQKTDELLGTTGGRFFCDDTVTAADVAWAPFLERYRYQLPCLYAGLHPFDAKQYPHLTAWYTAMDTTIPAYACRVKGDASSWRKVLSMTGFGNFCAPPEIAANMQELLEAEVRAIDDTINNHVWKLYASSRPHLAETCQAEAALIMTTNREAIIKDAMKRPTDARWNEEGLSQTEAGLDVALRALVHMLIKDGEGLAQQVQGVGALARFLDERMCVPRDMGAMSAASVKKLAIDLP